MLDGMRYAESEVEEKSSLIGKLQPEKILLLDRRLVVALDVPTVSDAKLLVDRLGESGKILQNRIRACFCWRPPACQDLRKRDKWIFLDMKLLDIGNTVEKGVASIAKLDFQFLTIHGLNTKTLRAAIDGRGDSRTEAPCCNGPD